MKHNIENNWNNQYIKLNIEENKYKNKKRKRKKNKKIILIIILLIIIIFLIKHFCTKQNNKNINNNEQNNQIINISKGENSIEDNNVIIVDITNEVNNNVVDNNNENKNENENNNNENKNENNNTNEENDEENNEENNYSKPVSLSKEVGLDYFKDAVFIGNSRTEGFILNNSLLSYTNSYTSRGLKVDTIFTDRIINMYGKKVTIMDALKDTSFSKVYIMLGINETGWVYSSVFIKKYSQIIDEIRKINPNCTIYVQSILPVTKKVSDEHSYIKNARIDEFNSLIMQMANDKNVYYINVKEAVMDENGALPEEAATDGIHLNKKYCEKWLEYLKNHVVEEN